MSYLATLVLTILLGLAMPSAAASGRFGEFYSESTYVPKYGVLTDTQLRYVFLKTDSLNLYLGAALQRQDKTDNTQTPLYEKSLSMLTAGLRVPIWKSITFLGEIRSENRSHYGITAGDLWAYPLADQEFFTEAYGESLAYPYFHASPVTTVWAKEGLRYHVGPFMMDPYAEVFATRSPDPNLGRNTEQIRFGLRTIKLFESTSLSLLVYQSFDRSEGNHAEALLVFGGNF